MAAMKPQDIRNIIFLGHGGSGKTTLGESILHVSGKSTRLGSVNDGTSVLDWSDIEKDRKHTVDPSLFSIESGSKTINIIDTPGYPDFVGAALGTMSGADIAVVFVSAAAGIEVNTRRLFNAAKNANMPIAIVISKLDGENVDLERIMEQISETFGNVCKPMILPVDGGKSVVDCFSAETGTSDMGDVSDAHTELIESIVEADEEMMESYLGGEEIPTDKLVGAFSSAMVAGTVIPIICTASRSSIGTKEFIEAVAKYFPSPAQVPGKIVMDGTGEDAKELEISCDSSKPFVGQAFKIMADPFVGKLAWVRVLQGTASGDTTFVIRDEKKGGKIGHPFKVQSKETEEISKAVAGDIIALAKVEALHSGNILHTEIQPMFRDTIATPHPMYSLAVSPKSRGDEQKMSEALSRLTEEDATFVASRDSQTHETVISGIGDLHLRIILTKMKQRFDLEVETKPPKIPYRETISAKADGHYRHKKQTGGAGQFGEVYLRVEPLERGAGYEYVNELFGESIPRQFLPAIEKGVHDIMTGGALAGYPMQDILVAITDGKHHPVDSKEVAFRAAGKNAFIAAIKKAKPVLLEPLVDMEITIPANFMGDIASDLSGKRGRIIGQDMLPGNMCVIKAQAPLSEVMRYNSQLRSVTGGQGSYTMELSHYEPVPGNVQQQIIADAQKEKEHEKEK